MKIVSPQILHKTEAKGVLVGLRSTGEVRKGFATIIANAKKYDRKAELLGVQVQQMVGGGQEVIIGAVTDPSFGKLVAFGLGGVLVEVLKDVTFRLAPASKDDALSMLDGIAAADILKGVRGAKGVNRAALATMIRNVSQLVADFPEISEMDLNPVFATDKDATAADVRIVLDPNPPEPRFRPKHEDIVRDMNRIMKPDAVAVIGASGETGKIGNSVMKNLINGGYQGKIYPINPTADEIMGLKAYKSVKDVPGDIDVAGIRDSGQVRRRCARRMRREEDSRRGAHSVGLRRDGQRRGPEGDPGDRAQIRRAADGPQHLRLSTTRGRTSARPSAPRTTSRAMPRSRRSRAASGWRSSVSRARRRWACPRSWAWATNPTSTRTICSRSSSRTRNTHIIAQHCEDLKDGRSFAEVAKRVSKKKPVVMLKAGRTALGARAASSHTGALAGNDKIYDDVLRQSGVIRAKALRELLEYARAIPVLPTPKGENVIIITGAGGSGVLLSDACVDNGLNLMKMPPDLDQAFRKFIPPFGAAGNPVDITGGEPPTTYKNTIRLGLEDPRIHSLILGYWHTIITPPMVFAQLAAEVVEEMKAKGIQKPVVASLAGDVQVEEAAEYLFDHGIPAYPYSTEMPVMVLGAKYKWARGAGLI
jgi:acyl-CoA synthetase (NDP forming)